MDKEATPEVKKTRLHSKAATTVFFESNGGQQRGEATLTEVRLAVGEPDLDIGNEEQSLEALADTCYYLSAQKNRYRFSFQPNLNKLLADRRASVSANATRDRVRVEIQKVFGAGKGVERVFFPERSNQVPDRAALTLVVLAPENEAGDPGTSELMQMMTKEHGTSSRTYKSALIWCVAEDTSHLAEGARKVLAWQDIEDDATVLRIDENQCRQLEENLKRAERDLRETVWRCYKNVYLLDERNSLRKFDLGLVHSSAADSIVSLILDRLRQEDVVADDGVSPRFLTRNWPPALPEWSTKALRDAFFASPAFPRLLEADTVKQTICRGVEAGMFAYVSKRAAGSYDPFVFRSTLKESDVEVTDDVFIIREEDAEAYLQRLESGQSATSAEEDVLSTSRPTGSVAGILRDTGAATASAAELEAAGIEVVPGFRWIGQLAPQKWMNFYTKILARFAATKGLKLTLTVEVNAEGGVSKAKIEEVVVALRELGLAEGLEIADDRSEGDADER